MATFNIYELIGNLGKDESKAIREAVNKRITKEGKRIGEKTLDEILDLYNEEFINSKQ